MYNYTQAPNLPNSMGGGYFLAYKKLVSSFSSPPFTYKQNNHKTTNNTFINCAVLNHNNINHLIHSSVCLFEYSLQDLERLILKYWAGVDVCFLLLRLLAPDFPLAESHPERSPQRRLMKDLICL